MRVLSTAYRPSLYEGEVFTLLYACLCCFVFVCACVCVCERARGNVSVSLRMVGQSTIGITAVCFALC